MIRTLDYKTSHNGLKAEQISFPLIWFVMIGQYLAEIQLFEYLQSEVEKKSKY